MAGSSFGFLQTPFKIESSPTMNMGRLAIQNSSSENPKRMAKDARMSTIPWARSFLIFRFECKFEYSGRYKSPAPIKARKPDRRLNAGDMHPKLREKAFSAKRRTATPIQSLIRPLLAENLSPERDFGHSIMRVEYCKKR